MPVSSIAQVLLRIYALHQFLTGFLYGASFIITHQEMGRHSLYQALVFVVFGAGCWLVAPWVSRIAAKGNDGEFQLKGVNQEQLFATGFLVIGLYFALGSFATLFNWIHFFIVNQSPDYGFHKTEEPSYYSLTEAGLNLVMGIAIVLTSRTWAARLCRERGQKTVGEVG